MHLRNLHMSFLLMLLPATVLANNRLDSIQAVYESTNIDRIKITSGIELVDAYERTNPIDAVRIGEHVLMLIDSIIHRGTHPDSLTYEWEVSTLSSLATAYSNVGDKKKCLDHRMRSLELAHERDDRETIRSALANLGVIHQNQGNYQEAIQYYRIALVYGLEDEDDYGIAMALGNIGTAIGTAYPDSQLYYYKESLGWMKKEGMRDREGAMGWMMNNIGSWYESHDQLDSALHYMLLSLKIRSSINHVPGMILVHRDLAELYEKEGRRTEAFKHINASIELGERGQFIDYVPFSYLVRSNLREKSGDFNGALQDYRKFILVRDSTRNERAIRDVIQQSAKYEYGRKHLADSLNHVKVMAVQALDNELKQEKIRRARNIYLFSGLGIMLIAGGLWSRLRYVRRSRAAIEKEKDISEGLLLNILPQEVAAELKAKGQAEARMIEQVTVVFTDFKNFTAISENMSPKELVRDIHECFSAFDAIVEQAGIEKIKTIGDSYMAAGGLPVPNTTHPKDVIRAAFEMRSFMQKRNEHKRAAGLPFFEIRIGIHTGPVVAGIVGVKKFSYDIWGDTVNTASRIESSGASGKINISDSTYQILKDDPFYRFESRGMIEAKGKGAIGMYFVEKA